MPRVVLLVILFLTAALPACTEDAPSREDATRDLARECATNTSRLNEVGLPTDVFALEETARQAFTIVSDSLSNLQGAGLSAMDDTSVQRYLSGATAMNNALADLSNRASFEDVGGMRNAVEDADAAATELDAAAGELRLDESCGGAPWRRVLTDARTVIGLEAELMTPTGDYVVDVGTVCARYRRRIARAPEPASLEEDRRYALVVSAAASQLGDRLERLTLPPDQAERHDELLGQLRRVSDLLSVSETLAIDEKAEELHQLVAADVPPVLAAIDDHLAATGSEC